MKPKRGFISLTTDVIQRNTMGTTVSTTQCPKCGATINYDDGYCKSCWSVEKKIGTLSRSTTILEKRIKYLKISYIIEILLGILAAGYMSLFLGVMATDAPTSTYLHFVFGALFGFSIVAIPTVLIPFLAIRELNRYEAKGKLWLNVINVLIVMISVFMPLALWQFYMLYKIKST